MVTKQAIVDRALKSLMDAEGRITPEAVVSAAKDKNHPLHPFFEWDLKKAAYLHWLETASRLIRMVQWREQRGKRTFVAPFFVRDPERPRNEQGYRAIMKIRTDEEAAREVLVEEMAQVAGILKRAQSLAQVLGRHEELSAISAMVDAFIAAVEMPQQPLPPEPPPS